MAGRISLRIARAQGAAERCTECDDDFAIGIGQVTNFKATQRLMEYWAHGKGARKIRWFTDGSMRRCIRHLRKYFPQNAGGLCANLHKRATGEWPRGGVIPS